MAQVSAVVLLSGGLDSILAAKLLLHQGIRVVGVNFAGGYCPVRLGVKSHAQKAAEQLGIELVTLPIDEEFMNMVKSPKYGWGKNMNPCIDCHILMVKRAWGWTKSSEPGVTLKISFVATGEVLGQRPMSQNKQALAIVARRSGVEGYLLRPLSAKLLPPTIPEMQGWVDREKLLDIQGRGRQRQMELAREFGITEYPPPAGGCLLTDRGYTIRLREALAHGEDAVGLIELLSLGRHFRLKSGAKVILGRNQQENEELLSRAQKGLTGWGGGVAVIDGRHLPGPLALVLHSIRSGEYKFDRLLAARLCARYSDKRNASRVSVLIAGEMVEVEPASVEEAESLVVR